MEYSSRIIISYYFKKKFIGWATTCDFYEMTVHKGLKGYGLTKNMAINNLDKKFRKKNATTIPEGEYEINGYQVKVKKFTLTRGNEVFPEIN